MPCRPARHRSTSGRRLLPVQVLLPVLVLVVGLAAGCSGSHAEPGAGSPEPPSTSPAQPQASAAAQSALDAAGNPAEGTLDNGIFTLSDPIFGGSSAQDGRLTSRSWDVYFVRDDGDVGAWGAGLDVFTSADRAVASAREQARFFACPKPRRTVEDLPRADADWVEATSCRHATRQGFRAAASMSRGVVTANLTVTGASRSEAEAALISVWPALVATAAEVVDALP